MLSPESTTIVRATLPVVGGAIETISARFYASMFADNPELERNLFNRGNQANGEQRSALAGSIAAFATLLVTRPDERPDAMLSRIANKHASLGIAPEQYVVVHKYLFGAIAEVLGDAVTPEVAQAWDEVYWLMANALIALEARLLSNTVEGWLQATVLQRQEQSADALSFTLRPSVPMSFTPGQYISVAVTLPDGARQIRQYSLSSAPERDDWRITVKRVRGGDTPEGEVSNWLHANVQVGDVLTISAPFGDLVLPPGDTPLLLASAGIGATPILSMVEHLAATGSARQVTVVHADRAPADHAHREELKQLVDDLPGAALHRWYETPCECSCSPAPNVGTVDLTRIDLPDRLVAYLCGPLPFMRGVRSQLLRRGVPASDIHYEVFGPDLWLGRD
ncbi:globin domain-containing protein [Streptosporangium sp. 'caverna']|uniref:globin domain-containing protein n=1 Tax=Streptosporangium sp. 'caverna' TaxID=2202249 RepID=UPI000D7D68ED|nr:globin domain-containing protein [Streptosporangium sp. 'caverna']AWS40260.1 hemin transporter [Streptosporangium sp. 'caverna']